MIAEKIREAISRPYALGQADKDYRTTPSISVLFRGQEQSSEALIKQADVAHYQAKEAGRNTVRFFNGAMQHAIEARIALEEALRRGLAAAVCGDGPNGPAHHHPGSGWRPLDRPGEYRGHDQS